MREASEPDRLKSPRHWEIRAEEVRTIRDSMRTAFARDMLQRIALDYERLARWAGSRASPDFDRLMMRLSRDYAALLDEIMDKEE